MIMIRRKFNSRIGQIIDLFITFGFYLFITIALHEFFHLQVWKLLGGEGYTIITPIGGMMIPTFIPQLSFFSLFLEGLSGGFGVAFLFFVKSMTTNDKEDIFSLRFLSVAQFIYGFIEAISVANNEPNLIFSWGAVVSFALILLTFTIILMIDYLTEKT